MRRRASGAGNLLWCQLALRLAGLSRAIHPGEYGDTIRQLIHSCRGEVGGRGASWTTPSPEKRGG
ncbi:hypothetical protein CRENBAI_012050, partial [Crenichthys baileyi]